MIPPGGNIPSGGVINNRNKKLQPGFKGLEPVLGLK
jgi:hypothetical protein